MKLDRSISYLSVKDQEISKIHKSDKDQHFPVILLSDNSKDYDVGGMQSAV